MLLSRTSNSWRKEAKCVPSLLTWQIRKRHSNEENSKDAKAAKCRPKSGQRRPETKSMSACTRSCTKVRVLHNLSPCHGLLSFCYTNTATKVRVMLRYWCAWAWMCYLTSLLSCLSSLLSFYTDFQCTLCEVHTKPNIFNPRRATEGRWHKRLQSSCPSWIPKGRLVGGCGGHIHVTSVRHTATKYRWLASFTLMLSFLENRH